MTARWRVCGSPAAGGRLSASGDWRAQTPGGSFPWARRSQISKAFAKICSHLNVGRYHKSELKNKIKRRPCLGGISPSTFQRHTQGCVHKVSFCVNHSSGAEGPNLQEPVPSREGRTRPADKRPPQGHGKDSGVPRLAGSSVLHQTPGPEPQAASPPCPSGLGARPC